MDKTFIRIENYFNGFLFWTGPFDNKIFKIIFKQKSIYNSYNLNKNTDIIRNTKHTSLIYDFQIWKVHVTQTTTKSIFRHWISIDFKSFLCCISFYIENIKLILI